MEKKKLKEFIDVLNKKHRTIKFTEERFKTQINFLDRLKQTFMLNLQILINICILLHATPIIVKMEFLIVKRSLITFSKFGNLEILNLLIGDIMTWKYGY